MNPNDIVAFYRGHRATRGYDDKIADATQCPKQDLGAVEQLMREKFHVLSGLDAKTFRREAKKAFRKWQSFLQAAGEG